MRELSADATENTPPSYHSNQIGNVPLLQPPTRIARQSIDTLSDGTTRSLFGDDWSEFPETTVPPLPLLSTQRTPTAVRYGSEFPCRQPDETLPSPTQHPLNIHDDVEDIDDDEILPQQPSEALQATPNQPSQLLNTEASLDSEDLAFSQENPEIVEAVTFNMDNATDTSSSSADMQIGDEEVERLRPLSDFAATSVLVPASAHSVSEDLFSGLFCDPDDERWVTGWEEANETEAGSRGGAYTSEELAERVVSDQCGRFRELGLHLTF